MEFKSIYHVIALRGRHFLAEIFTRKKSMDLKKTIIRLIPFNVLESSSNILAMYIIKI